ncbi:hypothetical protein K438DRAFT_1817047 [Mycena galopus ATCC 62051]|nr:hypothetical protein K438DRAFT_1817047 [Mycena galopus ATCC 62051]
MRVQFEGLEKGVIPIFPVKSYFMFQGNKGEYSISREQLPLVPAYAYTDYKCQGRTLDAAIVDISDCKTLQNAYVMLSRCRTLGDLAIIRPFPVRKIRTDRFESRHFYRLNGLKPEMWCAEPQRSVESKIGPSARQAMVF